jgi:hypothetical protein
MPSTRRQRRDAAVPRAESVAPKIEVFPARPPRVRAISKGYQSVDRIATAGSLPVSDSRDVLPTRDSGQRHAKAMIPRTPSLYSRSWRLLDGVCGGGVLVTPKMGGRGSCRALESNERMGSAGASPPGVWSSCEVVSLKGLGDSSANSNPRLRAHGHHEPGSARLGSRRCCGRGRPHSGGHSACAAARLRRGFGGPPGRCGWVQGHALVHGQNCGTAQQPLDMAGVCTLRFNGVQKNGSCRGATESRA